MRSKFSGNGREDNCSKRTAGEQRGNISWEWVGAGYNLTGASGTRSDFYSEFIRLPEDAENPIAIQCIEEQHHNSRNIRKEKEREIDWDKSMLPFKLFCSSNFTIDCIKGAPVRIFEADHRKQYLPIRLPIFLKHVELFIVMIQSRFVDIYSGLEFRFWKWIPLLVDSCERGFLIWRVEEGIF